MNDIKKYLKRNLRNEYLRLNELEDAEKLGTINYHISFLCREIRDNINEYSALELLNFCRDCRVLEADCRAALDVEKSFILIRPMLEHLKRFEKEYNIRFDEDDTLSIIDVVTYCDLEKEYKEMVLDEIEDIDFAGYNYFVAQNDDGDYIFKEV